MQSIWRKTALAVAVLGVAACVRQVWQVHYSVEGNNYTQSETLLQAPDGGYYAVGVTGNLDGVEGRPGFWVAKFSAAGTKRWEQLVPGVMSNFAHLSSDHVAAVDPQGNVYVAWPETGSSGDVERINLHKFTASGQHEASWPVLVATHAYVSDLELGADGNLYLAATGGEFLLSVTPSGEVRWQHTMAPASSFHADVEFFANGDLLHIYPNGITRFAEGGTLLSSVDAATLGVENIADALVLDESVTLLGRAAQGVDLIELDAALEEVDRSSINHPADSVQVVRAGNRICVAVGPSHLASGSPDWYQVRQYELDGDYLSSTFIPALPEFSWEPLDLIGGDTGCYLSAWYQDAAGKVSSRIAYFGESDSGEFLTDIPDFVVGDFVVAGKSVVQVGLTGEYDGSFTDVLLTKHRRY